MTGWAESLWQPELDADMFARTARRVCERYGEGLASAELPSVRANPQFPAWMHGDGLTDPRVYVHAAWFSGDPAGRVELPAGLTVLSPRTRALLVLDVVDVAMTELFAARGWDREPLAAVRRHVEQHDLGWSWSSPTKASPSRAYVAQARYTLLDDGFGSTQLEIRRRSDRELVTRTPPHLAFCTQAGFVRSARTIRWLDGDTVEFVPACGLMGMDGPAVRLRVDEPAAEQGERAPLWPRGSSSHGRAGDGTETFHEPVADPAAPRPEVHLAR